MNAPHTMHHMNRGRSSKGQTPVVHATYPGNDSMASSSSGSVMKTLSEMGTGMKQRLQQVKHMTSTQNIFIPTLTQSNQKFQLAQTFRSSEQSSSISSQGQRPPLRTSNTYDDLPESPSKAEETTSMLHGNVSSNPMLRNNNRDDDDEGEEIISFLESPTARRASGSYSSGGKKDK